MIEKLVKVQYVNMKNNFCYLNQRLSREHGNNETIKIQYENNKEAYFTLSNNFSNVPDDVIVLSSLYAKYLGIKENSEVFISSLEVTNKVDCFTVYPVKSEDYHVLDLLKHEVERMVLLQTKVVCENQNIIIWIGENLYIPVNVVSIEPCSPGILCNLTEMTIVPHVLRKDAISDQPEVDTNLCEGLKRIDTDIFEIPVNLNECEIHNERIFNMHKKKRKSFYGRLVPYDRKKLQKFSSYFYEFSAFMSKTGVHIDYRDIDSFEIPIFCSLELTNNSEARKVYIRIFLIDEECSAFCNIYANESLLNILNCKIGARVKLIRIHEKTARKIIIVRKSKNENIKDLLKEYLAEICEMQEFVLNDDVEISLKGHAECSLKFEPDSYKFTCVNKDYLRKCSFKIEDDPLNCSFKPSGKTAKKIANFVQIDSLRRIINEIVARNDKNLNNFEKFENFLITGKSGVGKSVLMKQLMLSFEKDPIFKYSEMIECKTLKGKTLDSLHRVLISIFDELVKHQPSVLFIDDLEILCENVNEREIQAQNTLYFNRISEMVYLLLKWLGPHSSVAIIATTNKTGNLNKNIYSSRGCYLFDNIFHVEELIKEDRQKILHYFLNDHSLKFDLDILSQETDGYVFQDLHDLTRKIIFETIKDGSDQISEKHVEKAFSQMKILSLIDVKIDSPGEKDFSHIGGSANVKKMLIENLLWPIKYSHLFNSAPLRLQSGMLLFGPPGTGKTLIAAAAAKHCGIRLISIKGPELLSKYIGASEQAVRNVFTRAQDASPCILFFDEFESLAPRRGHDITGVTDRVVNQLLTQLDGIESLNGVYVLAATSRPDLLDPALLRPGRLDKQIMCPLPDEESRKDILRILTKNMAMCDDVNLDEIAEKTDGYSGADLQSVLYNAQLSTMEHLLLLTEDNTKPDDEVPPITQETLRKSLMKIRPSLTRDEKRKYDQIYSNFQSGLNDDLVKPGTKASLA